MVKAKGLHASQPYYMREEAGWLVAKPFGPVRWFLDGREIDRASIDLDSGETIGNPCPGYRVFMGTQDVTDPSIRRVVVGRPGQVEWEDGRREHGAVTVVRCSGRVN